MTSAPTIETLRSHTLTFLADHWLREREACMSWPDPFPAAGPGRIANYDKQGCYALFQGVELRYIGLGASRGSGIYKGQGIGARIKHVLATDWQNRTPEGGRMLKVRDNWLWVTHISTFGFPSGFGYLAASLESYLLSRQDFAGLQNKNRPGAA